MGRPALPVGTHGEINYLELEPGKIRARALFRDVDGISRPVARLGKTKTAARHRLEEALRDRSRVIGDATVRSDMRVYELARVWLADIEASDRASGTKQQYAKVWAAYLEPALGELRVSEVTVPAADRVLKAILAANGTAVAKSSKAVLSGLLGLAERHGALPVNPVRGVEKIAGSSKPKKGKPRALTVAQTEDITDRLRTLRRAVDLDIPDLVDMALATGARIGELLACREGVNDDGQPLLDLDAGTWEVNATVVRIKGEGLVVQPRTKTDAGWRILALPPYAVAMLGARKEQARLRAPGGVVFGSPARRSLRDPSNAAGDLKECLRAIGYDWPTFHTFRKTVATRMKEAGCSDIEVADQLGHADPSMTRNVYMGRNVTSAKAAEVLDR